MTPTGGAPGDHWQRHARQWQHVGAPLRPSPDDVALVESTLARLAGDRPATTAVLLGVTPEIAAMRWPAGTRLVAADRCAGMIRGLWPHPADDPWRRVVCADWCHLPLDAASTDVVVGDGCYSMLDRAGYDALTEELQRILRPGGHLLMRFFVRPERRESTDDVVAALHAGDIGSFHVFKWRLAMSLHESLDDGVRLGAIWDAWDAAAVDRRDLTQRTGWPDAVIDTLDVYRDVDTCYTFPTLDEARRALAPSFDELACLWPDYELGERCPTLLLRA